MLQQPGVLDWALQQWKENGSGPLAAGVTGTAFLSYDSLLPPDTQSLQMGKIRGEFDEKLATAKPSVKKQLTLQKELLFNTAEADLQFNFAATGVNTSAGNDIANLFVHKDPEGYVTLVTTLTHPLSRGSIHIKTNHPKEYPMINPCYLSDSLDLDLLAEGVLFTAQIARTKPLANFLKDNDANSGKAIQPNFKIEGSLTKELAVNIVKNVAVSSFHPIGTCSMLPQQEGGVVDPSLKVYGTTNLRVVDASIIPLHVCGNITSLVYAIAEKAADIIKQSMKN